MTNIDPAIVEALHHPRCDCGHGPDIHDMSHGCDETVIPASGIPRCCPCFRRSEEVRLTAIAAVVADARAEGYEQGKADGEAQAREQFRRHIISDPEMHALHEAAKAYSLACSAWRKVTGGPLSTTLGFLIEEGYLVPADPRAARKATP